MGVSKKPLLVIVVLALAGVIVYDIMYFAGGSKNAGPVQKAGYSSKEPGIARFPEPRLDLLDQPRVGYKGVSKDIFGPFTVEPVIKPPVKAIAATPPPVLAPVPEAPPPPPPSRIKVFASSIRFVGFLEKTTERSAFFSRGEEVFILKKGDIFDRYRVTELTDAFIAFKDDESGEDIRVELLR